MVSALFPIASMNYRLGPRLRGDDEVLIITTCQIKHMSIVCPYLHFLCTFASWYERSL
jgi:hypothetical protein